jgi:oxygen-independent coproporphyrinogen-3 oxidase
LICINDSTTWREHVVGMTHDALHLALLTARVPRYTSYPPANRFSDTVGPKDAQSWIEDIPQGSTVSLYVHIPFCRQLCWFCACRTQGTKTTAPLNRYLEILEREIWHVAEAMPDTVKISALHLGGGTPTLLDPEQFNRLMDDLGTAFPIGPKTEISVEIDPCELDEVRLDALAARGLSRASVGVQDFAPDVQSAIGRLQSIETTERAITGLRMRGITSINLDLLYGLPHQTEKTLAETLARVLEFAPDRIALFGYAHVPWMARRQRLIPEDALPDPTARLALASLARTTLQNAGYVPVGIDHFALPGDSMATALTEGRLHRNFQGYTTDTAETLLGLGASSISRFRQGYLQNTSDTRGWQNAIRAGHFATNRGFILTDNDRAVADVIERLMCDATADIATICQEHHVPESPLKERARRVLADMPGLGRLDGSCLTVAGPEYARLLAAGLDPEFSKAEGGFSMAS